MDWKTFFSSMVTALAWPVLVGLVLWFVRIPLGKVIEKGEVRSLLNRITKLSAGKWAVELNRVNEELKAVTPLALNGDETSDLDVEVASERAVERLVHSIEVDATIRKLVPEITIIRNWMAVEEAIRQKAEKSGLSREEIESSSPRVLLRRLQATGKSAAELVEWFDVMSETNDIATARLRQIEPIFDGLIPRYQKITNWFMELLNGRKGGDSK